MDDYVPLYIVCIPKTKHESFRVEKEIVVVIEISNAKHKKNYLTPTLLHVTLTLC